MQVSVGSTGSIRLPPDYSISKYVRSNEMRAKAEHYIKDLSLASMQAGNDNYVFSPFSDWFESKTKFAFAEREKREMKT